MAGMKGYSNEVNERLKDWRGRVMKWMKEWRSVAGMKGYNNEVNQIMKWSGRNEEIW